MAEVGLRETEEYLVMDNVHATVEQLNTPTAHRRRGHVKPVRRSHWLQVAAILVAELVGTGVLALPHSFSALGLLPGLALLLIFSALSLYAGILLWRLAQGNDACITYGDAAGVTLGPRSRKLVFGLLYGCFFGNLSIYILTMSDTLRAAFDPDNTQFCTYTLTLAASLFLLPFCQLRTLHHISYVAAASCAAILLALVIIVWTVTSHTVARGKVELINTEIGFIPSMSAATTAIFAFGGQGIFFETIAEMRKPEDFPKAVSGSTAGILIIYLIVAVVCYLRFGDCVQGNVLYELHNGAPKQVAALLVFFHVAISYVVAQQIVCRAIHTRWHPFEVDTGSKQERFQWGIIATSVLFVAWLLANSIPFFTHLMGIVGAITTAPLTFVFPCVMYYSMVYHRRGGGQHENGQYSSSSPLLTAEYTAHNHLSTFIPRRELITMVILVATASYLMSVGMYSTMHELIVKWTTTWPFSCNLNPPSPSSTEYSLGDGWWSGSADHWWQFLNRAGNGTCKKF